MIDGGGFIPIEARGSEVITQAHLNEFKRAIGRDMWDFEFDTLNNCMIAQRKVNRQLRQRGLPTKGHSMDEVMGVFIKRIRAAESDRMADRMFKRAKEDGNL